MSERCLRCNAPEPTHGFPFNLSYHVDYREEHPLIDVEGGICSRECLLRVKQAPQLYGPNYPEPEEVATQ